MRVGLMLPHIGADMSTDLVVKSGRVAGLDPAALELIVFAFPAILDHTPDDPRLDFVGALDDIRRDVMFARDIGGTEIIFGPGYVTGDLIASEYLDALERLRDLA